VPEPLDYELQKIDPPRLGGPSILFILAGLACVGCVIFIIAMRGCVG
jgi:hypothetical protein